MIILEEKMVEQPTPNPDEEPGSHYDVSVFG
jgi:hypothetical protein